MYPIETGEYDGVELEEYKGNIYLVAKFLKNGKFYNRWAKYQIGKDQFSEKPMPVKVCLGEPKTATEALIAFVNEIDRITTSKNVAQDDEVPF